MIFSGRVSCLKQKPHPSFATKNSAVANGLVCPCVYLYTYGRYSLDKFLEAKLLGQKYTVCWIVPDHAPERRLCSHQAYVSTCLSKALQRGGSEFTAKLNLYQVDR